jgi:hypothetical protein
MTREMQVGTCWAEGEEEEKEAAAKVRTEEEKGC